MSGPFKLSRRSLGNLEGVHPDLAAVVRLAIKKTKHDFTVIEGVRSRERQARLVKSGDSKTMNSRHLTGHAVDIVPLDDHGNVSWAWPRYYPLADTIKASADELGIPIEWGGDWTSFKDGPHWQLPWAEYAKDDMRSRATDHLDAGANQSSPVSPFSAIVTAILRMFGK